MVKRPLAADSMPHNDRYLSLSEESNGGPAVRQRRPALVDNLLEVSDLRDMARFLATVSCEWSIVVSSMKPTAPARPCDGSAYLLMFFRKLFMLARTPAAQAGAINQPCW